MPTLELLEKVKTDPRSVYPRNLSDLFRDRRFSKAEITEIIAAWRGLAKSSDRPELIQDLSKVLGDYCDANRGT